jgi:NADPH-dependent curcumin reductase CurA
MSVPSHADVIVLNRRPGPALRPGDLVPERRPLRGPGPGEVTVRNVVTSVDPYQLQMLRGSPEVTPVAIGEPVPANSVGVVVRSEDPGVPVGAQVATYTGWQAYATTTIAPAEIANPALGGPLEWISVLGTTGVTGYMGIHDIGRVRADSTVLVSAATGAVGGVAVHLAKAAGARVVAIAGGRGRTDHAVQVLGADVAVDYRDPPFPERFKQTAGDDVDMFFDNVGGRQLTLASSRAWIARLRPWRRSSTVACLYRQAGRPDLGGVGRGATLARATPGRTSPQPRVTDHSAEISTSPLHPPLPRCRPRRRSPWNISSL